ncbi:DUF1624 domain-containing protein [Methanosarcina sp. KYL-1]|uniref:heparan-alpha-glucosaminide N-acetyltransferase n=1 Tax=Methanosarcina sp. KYL-1 TaxID=2602068 RepID=UPI002101311F|nr:heparan-alpha-glucosaminide N-acetyltransferase [Methanosarcina sp. KYL-1]MCQ1535074.1 DUF1624 domain-containing protein [Methanosarcina sp. KYL-1]
MHLQTNRFPEIDLIRGLAVLFMLVYHFLYDLDFFGIAEFKLNSGPLLWAGRGSAFLFIMVSGTALSISYSRAHKKKPEIEGNTSPGIFPKYLKRGVKLFSLGLLLTGITWIFLPGQYIIFGILHFFGVSAVLAYPFLKYGKENLFFGLFFGLFGLYLRHRTFGFSSLLWLGFRPEHFRSLDYFPIFPWFGVLLLGIYLGSSLYTGGKRQFEVPGFASGTDISFKGLSSLGKHSLAIYFAHQPFFLGLFFLGGFIDPGIL